MKRATDTLANAERHEGISIHALVKRATKSTSLRNFADDISIHALVKRATGLIGGHDFYLGNFNPRPREEGDVRRSLICPNC